MLGVVLLFSHFHVRASSTERVAYLLNIEGAIGPAVADYVKRGIIEANKKKAAMVILKINTPGGLDTSMREMIITINESSIPVVSFVAPTGSRAASAGTFILYASHVAAMAPGTNLGAASPVAVGGGSSAVSADQAEKDESKAAEKKSTNKKAQTTIERKATNDAIAYIRSLAELRGRNADWAEQAVRSAASISADTALKLNVIDLMAEDVPNLLQKIDGRKVKVHQQTIKLDTQNLTVQNKQPDWRSKFLSIITDPSVAYLLLLVGVYGLFIEFANPGFVLPGVAGVIAMLLALYAFQLLPINYVGLALMFLGITFMVTEAFMPSFGVLGIGGVIGFIIGSIMLMDTDFPGYQLAYELVISVGVVTGLAMLLLTNLMVRSLNRPIVSGRETLVGSTGKVIALDKDGVRIRVVGEVWLGKSSATLTEGQKVKVTSMEGLVLTVEPKD